jgi:hypothetical protein
MVFLGFGFATRERFWTYADVPFVDPVVQENLFPFMMTQLDLRLALSCSFLYTRSTKRPLEMYRFGSGKSSLALDKLDLLQERNRSWLEKCGICEALIGGGYKCLMTDDAWMQHLKELVV